MQSVLQYRRFHAAVKAQLEKDQGRVKGQSEKAGTGSFPQGAADRTHRRDIEPGNVTQEPVHREPTEEKPQDDRSTSEDEEEEEEDSDRGLASQARISRTTTGQSERTALGRTLTGIEIRKRTTREGGSGNVFVVDYQGPDDPMNPKNWSRVKRFSITFLVASIGCVVGIASAIDSSALREASEDFGVSPVVESLATGLFLIGFGLGALFAGPLSETVGRNPVYIVTLVIYMVFVVASAVAPNIGAQLAFRFIGGCFASTPLTCAGGSISDLWNPLERTFSFPIFANAAFTGPLLGPVMGGWIVQSSAVSWRWVEWVTLIISGVVLTLVVLLLPETYPPVLLKWKSEHLRRVTEDDRYRAAIEIRSETFLSRLGTALYRPFLLTSREPIIMLVALYLTVVYIVLFTFLEGYDYIFAQIHGTSEGVTGLCFLGIIIGLFGATALVPLIYKWAKEETHKVEQAGGEKLPPEFRLWFSMLGGSIAIPISLFWMAWTSYPGISIWSPLASSVLFGYGILCVFITSYQYIIDSYELYAASALSSITLIRYAAAGGMTVVATPFYKNMGVHYTLTIMACLSALLAPVPYVFYKYGPWIRSKSKYAVSCD